MTLQRRLWPLGLLAGLVGVPDAYAQCAQTTSTDEGRVRRPVEPSDLARLRDIGSFDSSDLSQVSPLSISPDGAKVAFILTIPDPTTNTICRRLLVLDLAAGSQPQVLDEGGDPILAAGAYRGLVVVTGAPETIRPVWSSDGRLIAYLRRDNGTTQVWAAEAADGRALQRTQAAGDVDRVAWTQNGRTLTYAVRTGEAAFAPANAAEAMSGWAYDERMTPNRGPAPQVQANLPQTIHSLEAGATAPRPANATETQALAVNENTAAPRVNRAFGLESPDGLPLTPLALWGIAHDGRRIACPYPACRSGIVAIYPELSPGAAYYLRREGWAYGRLSLYRWQPDANRAPVRQWTTARTLLGCQVARARLVCLSETASQPRTIVSIDPRSGNARNLFDPNPAWQKLALGKVVHLKWRNDLGLEARGDLVLPSGMRPPSGWPLIVVQYHSKGFLRGGTGDEVPIFALAAAGFAVLSVEQPTIVATRAKGLRTFDEVNAYNARNWAERRSLLSSLLVGVDRVVARGDADRAKVGITGLSDGATSVAFALINSRAFAAASISTCCTEPWSVMAIGGPAWAANLRSRGYPAASDNDAAFWQPLSLAANAPKIETPLLMQLADDEYLLALQTYAALREHRQPVDMFVFPGEHHVKWQPAHRLAVYRRNIDWFAFWLLGQEDPNPAKAAQYARWRALRARN